MIANMFLGILILKKKYCLREYVSILFITIGIVSCTLASSSEIKSTDKVSNDLVDFLWWIVGKKR